MTIRPLKNKKSDPSRYYVDKKSLYADVVKFKESIALAKSEGRDPPQMPRSIGQAIMLICTELNRRYNFSGYTYNDEMVASGILDCTAGIYHFDHVNYKNVYAYLTTCAIRASLRVIAKEKKMTYVKIKSMEKAYISKILSGEGEDLSENDGVADFISLDSAGDFVKKYEEKMNIKSPSEKRAAAKSRKSLKKRIDAANSVIDAASDVFGWTSNTKVE